jgi:nucleotide-binding universal stress UspA family protein
MFVDWDCVLQVEVKTEVVVGDPKEKICEVTANRKADLLVMGCRAIGSLQR